MLFYHQSVISNADLVSYTAYDCHFVCAVNWTQKSLKGLSVCFSLTHRMIWDTGLTHQCLHRYCNSWSNPSSPLMAYTHFSTYAATAIAWTYHTHGSYSRREQGNIQCVWFIVGMKIILPGIYLNLHSTEFPEWLRFRTSLFRRVSTSSWCSFNRSWEKDWGATKRARGFENTRIWTGNAAAGFISKYTQWLIFMEDTRCFTEKKRRY